LDESAAVFVWALDVTEILWAEPLPPGDFDTLAWVDDTTLAVRQHEVRDDEGETYTWWLSDVQKVAHWRPETSVPSRYGVRLEAGQDEDGTACLMLHSSETDRRDPTALKHNDLALIRGVDPLGRFALLAREAHALHVVDLGTAETIHHITLEEGDQLLDVEVDQRGQQVWVGSAQGRLLMFDPMRPGDPIKTVATLPAGRLRCISFATDHSAVAVGESSGQITLYDAASGRRVFRSRRSEPGFDDEFVLCEEGGFVGTRDESIAGYLADDSYIAPAIPLPDNISAACASTERGRVVFSVALGFLLELDLHQGEFVASAELGVAFNKIAAAKTGLVGTVPGGMIWLIGDELAQTPLADTEHIQRIATDATGSYAALVWPDRLEVWAREQTDKPLLQLSPADAPMVAATFATFRDQLTLALVDTRNVLWRWVLPEGPLRRVGVIEDMERTVSPVRTIDLNADADGSLRLLSLGHHHHRLVHLVDPATAEATLMGSLIVSGDQIVSLMDDEGVWIDRDADIRLVSDLSPTPSKTGCVNQGCSSSRNERCPTQAREVWDDGDIRTHQPHCGRDKPRTHVAGRRPRSAQARCSLRRQSDGGPHHSAEQGRPGLATGLR